MIIYFLFLKQNSINNRRDRRWGFCDYHAYFTVQWQHQQTMHRLTWNIYKLLLQSNISFSSSLSRDHGWYTFKLSFWFLACAHLYFFSHKKGGKEHHFIHKQKKSYNSHSSACTSWFVFDYHHYFYVLRNTHYTNSITIINTRNFSVIFSTNLLLRCVNYHNKQKHKFHVAF